MKYFSTLCIISCLLLFNSCKDDKQLPSNLDSNKEGSYLTVKIDGVNHSFNDKVTLGSTSKSNITDELSHIVNGYNKEEKTRITLGINLTDKTTGTFKLSGDMVMVYHSHTTFLDKRVYYIWHAKKSAIGSSGTITVTKNNDTHYEGTFSFKGVGSSEIDTSVKNFTEGKFRVKK